MLNTQNVKYFSYEYERITERLNELQQKITEYLLDISQVNKKNDSFFFNKTNNDQVNLKL